jgi:hypothetical protein
MNNETKSLKHTQKKMYFNLIITLRNHGKITKEKANIL